MVEQKLPKLTTRVRFPSLAPFFYLTLRCLCFSHLKSSTSFYWIFIIAIILVLEAIFFRTVLWNDTLIGDDDDARLNILIMEHIWQFLHGIKDFADLGMFYPYQNTISYSDMNVGFTKGRKAPYKYQLDAWEIATHFKLKTINGYSGQFPKDWSSFGLFRLNEEKYLIGMEKYLKKYNLENVCTYDLGRNTWSEKPIISIKQLQNKKE